MSKNNFYIMYRMFKKDKVSGQITALLTLVVAIVFLFVAVLLNLGKVSENKLRVTLAADSGVTNLASMISSIGSYYRETDLGGAGAVCRNTDILVQIGSLILAIVLTAVGQPHMGAAFLALAIAGISLRLISLVINEVVIEPGIVEAWNKEMHKLSEGQRYVESAIRPALVQAVTDNERIQDIRDYDMDGETDDYISRFASWYLLRLKNKAGAGGLDTGSVSDFICKTNGLAQTMGSINVYGPPSSAHQCSQPISNYVDPHTFLDFMGHDNTVIQEHGVPLITQGTIWPATGLFSRLYFIEELGSDKDGIPYYVLFWNPGVTPDDPTGSGEDKVDNLKRGLEMFYKWGFGQIQPEWSAGIATTPVGTLAANLNKWFWQDLYHPADPLNTWYFAINDWITWMKDMIGSSTSAGSLANLRSRMSQERTMVFVALAANSIAMLRAMPFESGCPAPACPDSVVLVLARARINELTSHINSIGQDIAKLNDLINKLTAFQSNVEFLATSINSLPGTSCGTTSTTCEGSKDVFVQSGASCPPFSNACTNRCRSLYNTKPCDIARCDGNILQYCQDPTIPCTGGTTNCPTSGTNGTVTGRFRANSCITESCVEGTTGCVCSGLGTSRTCVRKGYVCTCSLQNSTYTVETCNNMGLTTQSDSIATYSWQDENKYWHHVRVMVAAPCGYPWIETTTNKTLGVTTEHCYHLRNDTGELAVRVQRYDQEQSQPMKFAWGGELWKFIFHNFTKGQLESYENPANPNEALPHGISYTACAHYGSGQLDIRHYKCQGLNDAYFTSCH